MQSFLDSLKQQLGDRSALQFSDRAATSAVLWVPNQEERSAEILFIRRADRPEDRWAKQIGLPGGRREGNESDVETAERETFEEVGLDLRSLAQHLGPLDCVEARKGGAKLGFGIYPFLYATRSRPNLRLDPEEVSECFWVPLEHLLDPNRAAEKSFVWQGREYLAPAIALDSQDLLWGLTYRVIKDLLQRLDGIGYTDFLREALRNSQLGLTHFREFPEP